MSIHDKKKLERFGFSFEKGGAHGARTMMLNELTMLLDYVADIQAHHSVYRNAIEDENCLGKRSGITRKLSARHLTDLYALDPNVAVFRALRFFWERDPAGRPVLALLCAYSRDAILRSTSERIQSILPDDGIDSAQMEEYLDSQFQGRYSKATLKSVAQNVNSSWTQAGYLKGRISKRRIKALVTPGSVAYAVFLAYLNGARGEGLFSDEYVQLLDCEDFEAMEMVEEAARRGWLVFKRIERIIEVRFPRLLTSQEVEWIHEQT